jgi:preprotein translocase subunit SecF
MRPFKLVRDSTNVPFISYRWWALTVSIILMIASVALVSTRGLNWGIDFIGGQAMRVTFAKPVEIGALRTHLETLDVGDVVIQRIGTANEINVRIPLAGGTNPMAKKATQTGSCPRFAERFSNPILARISDQLMQYQAR